MDFNIGISVVGTGGVVFQGISSTTMAIYK